MRWSTAALGVLPNLVLAVFLLYLVGADPEQWRFWVIASAIVLVTELVMLTVALELRRRQGRS
jgi:Na+/melibiose symporter-like transporter